MKILKKTPPDWLAGSNDQTKAQSEHLH